MNGKHVLAETQQLVEPNFLGQRIERYYSRYPKNQHPYKTSAVNAGGVILSSTDYLSLGGNQDIAQAQAKSFLTTGNRHMSRVFFGDSEDALTRFEEAMAEFMGAESTLLCQSGWCANTSLIQSICDDKNPVYIDIRAHASLWEGITAAGATARPFRHNSCEMLEKTIKRHGQGTIVVDALYSTQGDIAPLADIAAIAKKYGCILIVDESHSLGLYGKQGAGLISELGLTDQVHFRTASLSKGFASRGGIIAGSKRHMDYIRYEARPLIFSSAVLAHEAEGLMASLNVIKQEEWRRKRLFRNANYLRLHLLNMGYNVTASQSHIIGLEAGPAERSNKVRIALESFGVFGALFWEPATPVNETLLRFTVTANLSQEQLNKIVASCYAIRDRVELWDWASTKRLAATTGVTYPLPKPSDSGTKVSERVVPYEVIRSNANDNHQHAGEAA